MSELQSPQKNLPAESVPEFVDKLRAGRAILFKPRGHAMEPYVADGTIVMIDPINRPLQVGDVVLAWVRNTAILQRVVKLRLGSVWLWGDGTVEGSSPLPSECIVGIARLERLPAKELMRIALRRLASRVFGTLMRLLVGR